MKTETGLRPRLLGLEPSFGFGDRIGLATPGHVAAMHRAATGIQPIFPQQSIREMQRTVRTAAQVMQDALHGALQAGWSGVTGADADHLKRPADVDVTRDAGFCFYTIDPSEWVDGKADGYDQATLATKFAALRGQVSWYDSYAGRSVTVGEGHTIEFSPEACQRCAVKYGTALEKAIELADYIRTTSEAAGSLYEIELSVDETEQPTTLAEHFIVAEQSLKAGMKLVSLAPRYIGDFEKGVDYKGDVAALEASLAGHAAIARDLGPYKLSLHSGSDKLSMYPALARATRGQFHVKTAGTSYLEALRVVVRHDLPLFRRIVEFARDRYDTDRATYHVSAEVARVPAGDALKSGSELEQVYLERWSDAPPGAGFTEPGRQILHTTFGSTLTDPTLGPAIRGVLVNHLDTYTQVLEEHFFRHLQALEAGL